MYNVVLSALFLVNLFANSVLFSGSEWIFASAAPAPSRNYWQTDTDCCQKQTACWCRRWGRSI